MQSTPGERSGSRDHREIIEAVLAEGLEPYQRTVHAELDARSYAKREYCLRCRESDFDFVTRLRGE